MATKIETLKKPNGDQVLPRTRAKAVSMENGTTVEAAIADINTSINNLPSVDGHIGAHNTSADSHSDIRTLVQNLTTRLNALADSDDITLDQMSELVAYIKSNKSLIEQVTTNKVNVTDVINNLTTEASDKPLSAAQGAVLKGLIDELASIDYVDEKLIMLQSSLDKTIRGKADKADVEDDLAALESKLTKSIEGKATDVVKYTPQTLTEEQKAQARENIGAAVIVEETDEQLLQKGVFVTNADEFEDVCIARSWWTHQSINSPLYLGDTEGKFCTRKLNISKIPIVTVSGTNDYQYVFWKNGLLIDIVVHSDKSKPLEVDFEFDAFAINFSYGCDDFVNGDSGAYIRIMLPEFAVFDKVLIISDSISADYYGNYTKWVTNLINDRYFSNRTTNSSIHATGFVARYGENNAEDDFISRIKAIENPETYNLVIIFGGINDFIQAIPMGGVEGETDIAVYFKPAVDHFFEYLVNNFEQARIVVISPLRTYNKYANTSGIKQEEYAAYIREVAKMYCLPVLNLTEESGFCPSVDAFKQKWTFVSDGYDSADGVHPNEEYQRKHLTPMIKNFLSRFV